MINNFPPKKYSTYKGWTLDHFRSGGIGYLAPHSAIHVYCTPDYGGNDGVIMVQVFDMSEGVTIEEKDIVYPKPLTSEFWFSVVKPYLDKYLPYKTKEMPKVGSTPEVAPESKSPTEIAREALALVEEAGLLHSRFTAEDSRFLAKAQDALYKYIEQRVR